MTAKEAYQEIIEGYEFELMVCSWWQFRRAAWLRREIDYYKEKIKNL